MLPLIVADVLTARQHPPPTRSGWVFFALSDVRSFPFVRTHPGARLIETRENTDVAGERARMDRLELNALLEERGRALGATAPAK